MRYGRVLFSVFVFVILSITSPVNAQVDPTTPNELVEESLDFRCDNIGVILNTEPASVITEATCNPTPDETLRLTAVCGEETITISATNTDYRGYLAFVEFYGPCPGEEEKLKMFGVQGGGACSDNAVTFNWTAKVLRYLACWNVAPMP